MVIKHDRLTRTAAGVAAGKPREELSPLKRQSRRRCDRRLGLETETRFATIVEAFARTPSVTHSKAGSRLFGSSVLKVHDKIFTMISPTGHFVGKLPKARIEQLVATGVDHRFDASRGQPTKEWLEVRSASAEEWLQLAREAFDFVGSRYARAGLSPLLPSWRAPW